MRAFLLVSLTLVAVAAGHVEVQRFYHEAVGIPLAAKIKAHEENIHSQDDNNRIVGGAVAPVNAHPYLAGLLINFVNVAGQSVCGSSLLSANRLITAAHCWFDGRNQASMFTVVLGSHFLFNGGTRISTSSVVVHPQWIPSTLNNDVAMIILPTNVFFSTSIQPIALPSTTELWDTFAGEWGTAAGYGLTSDRDTGVTLNQVVSQVNLQVITVAACQGVFGTVFALPSNICTNGAGGVGICSGDSGGPLVLFRNGRLILTGVSSYVASAGCELGFPSAFARITSFYSFIISNM